MFLPTVDDLGSIAIAAQPADRLLKMLPMFGIVGPPGIAKHIACVAYSTGLIRQSVVRTFDQANGFKAIRTQNRPCTAGAGEDYDTGNPDP